MAKAQVRAAETAHARRFATGAGKSAECKRWIVVAEPILVTTFFGFPPFHIIGRHANCRLIRKVHHVAGQEIKIVV